MQDKSTIVARAEVWWDELDPRDAGYAYRLYGPDGDDAGTGGLAIVIDPSVAEAPAKALGRPWGPSYPADEALCTQAAEQIRPAYHLGWTADEAEATAWDYEPSQNSDGGWVIEWSR